MHTRFLLVVCFWLCACVPNDARPQSAVATSPSLTVEQLVSDFDALYAGLQRAHIDLYAHRPQADFDAKFETMRAGFVSPLSSVEAQRTFQAFVAYGNVAHARIDFPQAAFQAFIDAGGRTFPIYLRIADGRAYVDDNRSGLMEIEPGAEIIALDGEPISTWLDRLARNISADTPAIAHSLLEFTFPGYIWLERGELEGMSLTYRNADGLQTTEFVPFLSPADQATLRITSDAFRLNGYSRSAEILDGNIAYLRPGPFFNIEAPEQLWDTSAFTDFLDQSFEQFLAAGSETLILDLRNNPGGDNSFSDPMVAWFADEPFRFASRFVVRSSAESEAANAERLDARALNDLSSVSARYAQKYAEIPYGETFDFEIEHAQPRDGAQFDGDVYVLINRHSYSNAVNVAAIVQDYSFGTIVGEATTDMATTFGAMERFTLDHSGFVVGYPKAHIIRPNGDTRTAGVTPDRSIPSPIAPTQTDSVLETLVSDLASQETPN